MVYYQYLQVHYSKTKHLNAFLTIMFLLHNIQLIGRWLVYEYAVSQRVMTRPDCSEIFK